MWLRTLEFEVQLFLVKRRLPGEEKIHQVFAVSMCLQALTCKSAGLNLVLTMGSPWIQPQLFPL